MVGLLEHCDYYHNLLGDVGMGENKRAILPERERGQWVVYHTSPQSFIITFSYLLT